MSHPRIARHVPAYKQRRLRRAWEARQRQALRKAFMDGYLGVRSAVQLVREPAPRAGWLTGAEARQLLRRPDSFLAALPRFAEELSAPVETCRPTPPLHARLRAALGSVARTCSRLRAAIRAAA